MKEKTDNLSGRRTQFMPVLRILAWAVLILFLIIIAIVLFQTRKGSLVVGETVPDFSLMTFDGKRIQLSDYRGKVVVLNFWASWCQPCEEEADILEAIWQHYRPQENVMFIGIDYVDTETEARRYLEKYLVSYPNAPDVGTRVSQIFRIRGVPETYILNPQGNLAYIRIGPFNSFQEIKSIIDPLLK
jgi:cytochrome c biogenesis protein CcmG/thiol:disulfide interchange protein DsbE